MRRSSYLDSEVLRVAKLNRLPVIQPADRAPTQISVDSAAMIVDSHADANRPLSRLLIALCESGTSDLLLATCCEESRSRRGRATRHPSSPPSLEPKIADVGAALARQVG